MSLVRRLYALTLMPQANHQYELDQWKAGMERLKHIEKLMVTGLTIFFGVTAYTVGRLQAQSVNDYWIAVCIISVLCICEMHGVERVLDAVRSVLAIEHASDGRLYLLTHLSARISWFSALGFLTFAIAPALTASLITMFYRPTAHPNSLYALVIGGVLAVIYVSGITRILYVLHRLRAVPQQKTKHDSISIPTN